MPKAAKIIMIVFVSIGLAFLAVGLITGTLYSQAEKSMVKVEGVVTGFERGNALVTFPWTDGDRTVRVSEDDDLLEVGSAYPLLVDPDDPSRFTDRTLLILMWVFGGMGALFAVSGGVAGGCAAASARRREELLGWGTRVTGTVTEVQANRNVRVNGRHPVRLLVACEHPVTREKTTVRSHDLWKSPLSPGDTVQVAFDPVNEKRYAVDVQEAQR